MAELLPAAAGVQVLINRVSTAIIPGSKAALNKARKRYCGEKACAARAPTTNAMSHQPAHGLSAPEIHIIHINIDKLTRGCLTECRRARGHHLLLCRGPGSTVVHSLDGRASISCIQAAVAGYYYTHHSLVPPPIQTATSPALSRQQPAS